MTDKFTVSESFSRRNTYVQLQHPDGGELHGLESKCAIKQVTCPGHTIVSIFILVKTINK